MTEERRSIALATAGVQLRAAGDGTPERFYGLAAAYNVRAPIGNPETWGFFEEFLPGTFAGSLAVDDQRMLIDHDSYYLVSRVSAGDLTLPETSRGVEVDSELDDELSYVRDLKVNVRKRRITGMSIGFRVNVGGDTWSTIDVEKPLPDGRIQVYKAELRTVHTAQLIEVSAVTWPAFVDTEAALRYAIGPALTLRGDADAINRRAAHRPELAGLLSLLDASTAPPRPAPATRQSPAELMDGYAARYRRLRG